MILLLLVHKGTAQQNTFQNPIITGFNPDPSICKVGKDYYLITSSFEYFPGVPVYHSTDLVNWEMIGHVLNRPSQLVLDGYESTVGGIYAPCIRYNKGTFYMVTTLVGKGKGNFICTATKPEGPWSEPHFIKNAPGIDPDLLFDDDGKVYMTGSSKPPVEFWEGHKQIWTQELNINTWQLVGEQKVVFDSNNFLGNLQLEAGKLANIVHIEGPHIYKKDGWYYGTFSHGGTGQNHAFSIFRSKNIYGPYEPNPSNPILTHRDLPTNYPITATGHADLVQVDGKVWAIVYLGKRPFDTEKKRTTGERMLLARETYLSMVDWSGEWPIVNPKGKIGRSELVQKAPNLKEHSFDKSYLHEDFNVSKLHPQWTFIRTPVTEWWSLSAKKGSLRMQVRPEVVSEKVNPSFIGKRQEHMNFTVSSKMDFNPQSDKEEAGLVLIRDRNNYIKYTISKENDKLILKLAMRKGKETNDTQLAQTELEMANLTLKINALGMDYTFKYSYNGKDWKVLKLNFDIGFNEFISGGRFTGPMIGMYASSNGNIVKNSVDFDYFYYQADK